MSSLSAKLWHEVSNNEKISINKDQMINFSYPPNKTSVVKRSMSLLKIKML